MDDRLTILCDEIKQLHEQYVHEVGTGGRKVWPRSIKQRALELDRLIGSTKKTAEMSGLSADTLYQWRSELKKSGFKSLAVVEKKPSVTVTVTNPESINRKSKVKISTVTVKTPNGYVIEDLPIEVAIEYLLKARGI